MDKKINTGDLVLAMSQVDNFSYSPKVVLDVKEKNEENQVSLFDGHWIPAERVVSVEEGLSIMIAGMTQKLDFAKRDVEHFSEVLEKLKEAKQDLQDPEISRECIASEHMFKQENNFADSGLGGGIPILVLRCARPGCKKSVLIGSD